MKHLKPEGCSPRLDQDALLYGTFMFTLSKITQLREQYELFTSSEDKKTVD